MKTVETIRKIIKPKLAAILFWIWLVTIFILSSIPKIPTAKLQTDLFELRLDYILHFGVYGLLSTLFFFWKSSDDGKFKKNELLNYLVLASIFAAMEETHQLWVDGRTFNPIDMLSNILGVFVGIWAWKILSHISLQNR